MIPRPAVACVLSLLLLPVSRAAAEDAVPPDVRPFLSAHCYDCHSGSAPEAGLDLESLDGNLEAPDRLAKWVRVFDRVHDGEMPPPEMGELDAEAAAGFLQSAGHWLGEHQRRQWEAHGRVRGRRLTNLQLERTLHDLLGIDIPLASEMTEEPRTAGFTTVAEGQAMSHFHMQRHLSIVDAALDEAFRRALGSPDEYRETLSAQEVSRRRPKSRTREPELIGDRAVVWSSRLIFYGRLPATTARESGWYRFVIRASALKSPEEHGVWCTVRSGRCVSSAPLLAWVGAFEATEQPQEWTFETWLPEGHMLEVRPGDATLKMARFAGGQVGTGEGEPQNVPGVGIHSVVMERIHRGPDNGQIRRWLFGDLEIRDRKREPDELISDSPKEDAAALMQAFIGRAFRRPVSEEEVAPYVAPVHEALQAGQPLLAALRGGYRAVLCSPRFLYFQEQPGRLDDYALASRLSYFLWNRMPDAPLLELAASGRLSDPQVLGEQVQRLLEDPRGENFVRDFAHEWLDLSEIDFTQPDRKLYRDFDVIVQHSMLQETHAFLQEMLEQDLSVTNLIDSEFTFLNSRLARYYEIEGVSGDAVQRVALREEDRRGGVLTQGAVLKVTANGTTTSPVIRGVWICDRLLGEKIPPPPKGVAAIEPDIRGATTIREMLAKHRSNDACAVCHVKIDPPGFALENYDPTGRWRDRYLALKGGRRDRGATIDASYELADGRAFENIEGFQKLAVSDPEVLARNVAAKLLTYGTGAPIGFADRPALEEIVAQTADADYGFRSLLKAVVLSPVFLRK